MIRSGRNEIILLAAAAALSACRSNFIRVPLIVWGRGNKIPTCREHTLWTAPMIGPPHRKISTRLTVFPERVLLPPALEEPFGALFQRLDEDRLGHLQRRRVSLPRLEVDRGKHAAVHGGIPEIAKTAVQTSFVSVNLGELHSLHLVTPSFL